MNAKRESHRNACSLLLCLYLLPLLATWATAQTIQPAASLTRQRAEAQTKLALQRYDRDHDAEKGRADFLAASKLDPTYPMPLFYLGALEERQEHLPQAVQYYEAFSKLDDHSDYFVQAQLRLDELRKRITEEATPEGRLKRQYDVTFEQAKLAFASKDFQAAADKAQAAIQIDPARWEAYAMKGTALAELKRFGDAVQPLKDAISRSPEAKRKTLQDSLDSVQKEQQAAELVSAADIAAKQNNHANAAEKYEQAFKLFSDRQYLAMKAAQNYGLAKNYPQSVRILSELVNSSDPSLAAQAKEHLVAIRSVQQQSGEPVQDLLRISQGGRPTTMPLTITDQRELDALMLISADVDKAKQLQERRRFLQEFLVKSERFAAAHPEQSNVLLIRATAAIELDNGTIGFKAAKGLSALGLDRSQDPEVRKIFATLERKGFLSSQFEAAEEFAKAKALKGLLERVQALQTLSNQYPSNERIQEAAEAEATALKMQQDAQKREQEEKIKKLRELVGEWVPVGDNAPTYIVKGSIIITMTPDFVLHAKGSYLCESRNNARDKVPWRTQKGTVTDIFVGKHPDYPRGGSDLGKYQRDYTLFGSFEGEDRREPEDTPNWFNAHPQTRFVSFSGPSVERDGSIRIGFSPSFDENGNYSAWFIYFKKAK